MLIAFLLGCIRLLVTADPCARDPLGLNDPGLVETAGDEAPAVSRRLRLPSLDTGNVFVTFFNYLLSLAMKQTM